MSGGRRDLARLAAVLAAGLLALSWLGFWELHADENDCVAIGWLLSRGWRLYSDVFSHHTPLDYLPSWALACLFGPSPALCRAFMLGLWAACCAALFALRRSTREGAGAAILFTLLSSLWLTYWMGEMMLVESYWGYAVVLLLALAQSPRLSPQLGAAAGALLGLVICASPVCAPAALLLAVLFARRRPSAAVIKGAASGLAAWLLFFGAWSLAHADLRRGYDDLFRFNAWSYAYFSGLEPGKPSGLLSQALGRAAVYFARTLVWTDFDQYFEGVLRLAVLAAIVRHAWRRRWFDAAWWTAFVVALRLRVEHFPHEPPVHGASYFLCATWLLADGAVRAWHALPACRRPLWTAGLVAGLTPTLIPTAATTAWLKAAKPPERGYGWLLKAVAAATGPDERIAAFPTFSRLYLETERLPAAPGVFYFPWQAAWPPEHDRVLGALRSSPPKLVCVSREAIWGVPWTRYAADIEDWLKAGYIAVSAKDPADRPEGEELYVRRDFAGELRRRCPNCVVAP